MKVAVLGCGPAGLVAAQAAMRSGAFVEIFSRKEQSQLYGAQYLHQPIPGVNCGRAVEVSYKLVGGDLNDYRRKVYGDNPHVGSVSPGDLEESHRAWNIRQAYEELWDKWRSFIVDSTITPDSVNAIIGNYDLVVSTVPRFSLCSQGHTFDGEEVWAMGSYPGRGMPYNAPENSIVCDASSDRALYRIANVFGYTTIEWPANRKPPIPGVAKVVKPVFHNCDCLPEVLYAGRYGEWRKGSLVHEVYDKVTKAIADESRNRKLAGA